MHSKINRNIEEPYVVVYAEKNQNGFLNTPTKIFQKLLKFNKINFITIDIHEKDFLKIIQSSVCFIFRFNYYDDNKRLGEMLIPLIRNYLKIPTFPDIEMCWAYDNKIRQYYLMKFYELPIIDTEIYYEKNLAMNALKYQNFPRIMKLKGGAGSMNVVKLDNLKIAKKYIKRLFGPGLVPDRVRSRGSLRAEFLDLRREVHRFFGDLYRLINGFDRNPAYMVEKNYYFSQEYLPNNDHDVRITILYDKAFCYRRFNRKNDFRASGSGLNDYNQEMIPVVCVQEAFVLAEKLKLKCTAIDFLIDKDGNYKIVEFSYTFVSEYVAKCPGYWNKKLEYKEISYIPEYLHLVDLLSNVHGLDEVQQPEINTFYEDI